MALKRGTTVQLNSCSVKVKEQLSEGGFAYVLRVRDAGSGGREFALKQINCGDAASRTNAQAELRLLQTLPPHPHIVSLIDTGTLKGAVLLLMELCTGGPMSDRIISKQRFAWPELLDAFGQITAAVVHLHSQTPPIAHRDLKIENVVLDADGLYKLCDFGSCTTRSQTYATRSEILAEMEIIESTTTAMYRAPEMVDLYQRLPISEKVDVWALGCILYTMAFCAHPFPDGSQLAILSASGPELLPNECPCYPRTVLEGLLSLMIVQDPSVRASAAEVLTAAGAARAQARAQVPAAAEAEAEAHDNVAPAGWLLKKERRAGGGGGLLGWGGGGSRWAKVWVRLEPAQARCAAVHHCVTLPAGPEMSVK
jgi:serine/threonine protein kinase